MEFDIDLEKVLFGIKDDKVTVYVLNEKNTAVRTIDELENNQGGRKVFCTKPHIVCNKRKAVDCQFEIEIEKIKKMPIRRKLRNEKIRDIKEKRKQAVIDYMKPYNELYKTEVKIDDRTGRIMLRDSNGEIIDDKLDVIKCNADYHFMDNLDEKLASAYTNSESGFLYRSKISSFPYHIQNFDELRKIEKDIQVAYDNDLKIQKEDIQKKQATEKLLDF